MLSKPQQSQLLDIAKESVTTGIEHGHAYQPAMPQLESALTDKAASFVTLKINHQLRGCIGSLIASRKLATDVAENAYAAAFRDTRFTPVTATELPGLTFHISVLSVLQTLQVDSEQALLDALKPEIDGLVISDGHRRATFLPAVWESLPDKKQFLSQLKLKAGFAKNYWSNTIKVERYTVQEFGDE